MNRPDPVSIAGKSLQVAEQTDLLVVGAGPAGLAASLAAARLGLRVVLVDENPVPASVMAEDIPLLFGGRVTGSARNRNAMTEAVIFSDPAIAEAFDAGIDVRLGTIVWGIYGNGPGVGWLPGPVAGLADGERSWMLGCRRIIVCTGRRDMGLAFAGWGAPGAVGLTAAVRLATRYGALATRRAIILGTTTEALLGAVALRAHGVEIVAFVEVAAEPADPAVLQSGIEVLCGHVLRGAETGADGIVAVSVATAGSERRIEVDSVISGIAAIPTIELLAATDCRIEFSSARGGHVPVIDGEQRTSNPDVFAAGDCAGIWPAKSRDAAIARREGERAAAAAAGALPLAPVEAHSDLVHDIDAYQRAWVRATVLDAGGAPYVCRCEEVTAREILELRPPRYLQSLPDRRNRRDPRSLIGENATNPDVVKRLTRAGMGICQGRRCREQVAALLALAAGAEISSVPLASYRAPVRPLPLALLAGETPEMASHWDTWFGMKSQYVPFWKVPRRYRAARRDEGPE